MPAPTPFLQEMRAKLLALVAEVAELERRVARMELPKREAIQEFTAVIAKLTALLVELGAPVQVRLNDEGDHQFRVTGNLAVWWEATFGPGSWEEDAPALNGPPRDTPTC